MLDEAGSSTEKQVVIDIGRLCHVAEATEAAQAARPLNCVPCRPSEEPLLSRSFDNVGLLVHLRQKKRR